MSPSEVPIAVLSYRHVFHAGNFADVHKHAAWLFGIRALLRKSAAFCLLDAYAGAGAYALDDPAALKTGEWKSGVGRLFEAVTLPGMLGAYSDAINNFNAEGPLQRYPGSPALAVPLLREQDRLVCLELHPADFPALKRFFSADPRVHVHRRDAREGIPALVPPPEKRGLVLVDPSYEQAIEYSDVPRTVLAAWKRWPTGSYLIWYPLLAANAHVPMLRALVEGGVRKLLVQELRLFPEAPGLRGSGLAWINPPWQVEEGLGEAGAWLCQYLGGAGASRSLAWQATE